jgi:hypothetical protein
MNDKMTESNRLTNLIEYLRGSSRPTFWPEGYCNVAADAIRESGE